MADLIVAVVVLGVVGAAVAYIRKEKKKGMGCVGCPSGGTCARRSKPGLSDEKSGCDSCGFGGCGPR